MSFTDKQIHSTCGYYRTMAEAYLELEAFDGQHQTALNIPECGVATVAALEYFFAPNFRTC